MSKFIPYVEIVVELLREKWWLCVKDQRKELAVMVGSSIAIYDSIASMLLRKNDPQKMMLLRDALHNLPDNPKVRFTRLVSVYESFCALPKEEALLLGGLIVGCSSSAIEVYQNDCERLYQALREHIHELTIKNTTSGGMKRDDAHTLQLIVDYVYLTPALPH